MTNEFQLLGPFCGRLLYSRNPCNCELELEAQLEHEERIELTKNQMIAASGLRGNLKEKKFEKLDYKDQLRRICTTLKEFCKTRDHSIILSGVPGCGKTHLAAATVLFLINQLIPAKFASVPEMLKVIQASWKNEYVINPVPDLIVAPVLVLDDLGTEEQCSDWARGELYRIIDGRYISGLPMLVTTNHRTASDLAHVIGDRSVDRLIHGTIWVDIPLGSYRAQHIGGVQ